MKVKDDHRSKFSNLSNWREEAWKNQGYNVEAQIFSGFLFPVTFGKFTAMIILHFHLQLQFKYELFHIYFASFNSSREDMTSVTWPRSQCVGNMFSMFTF